MQYFSQRCKKIYGKKRVKLLKLNQVVYLYVQEQREFSTGNYYYYDYY
jgi:hypothetical protein